KHDAQRQQQSHPARASIHGSAFYARRDSRYSDYRTRAARRALMHIRSSLKIRGAMLRPRLPPSAALFLLLFAGLREREVGELRRTLVGLNHCVVRVLTAVPIPDAQRAVGIGDVLVRIANVPRLDERLGVVDPDVDDDGFGIDFVPDFHRVELL